MQDQQTKISVFLYTKHEKSENKIKKTVPLTTASQKNKTLKHKFDKERARQVCEKTTKYCWEKLRRPKQKGKKT